MALPTAKFTQTTDFLNEPYKIAQDKYSKDSLQGKINQCEPSYLQKVLGARIYQALISDLDVNDNPQHPKFVALLNGDTYTDIIGNEQLYFGLRDMLRFFIWVEVVRKSNYVHAISGMSESSNENSTILARGEVAVLCRDAYNDAVRLARSANYFIQQFEDHSAAASSIALQSGTTYLVTITDTKYLANGDTVTINSLDYVIANLTDNTSFEIDSASDISGTNEQVDWTIFGSYSENPMEFSFGNM